MSATRPPRRRFRSVIFRGDESIFARRVVRTREDMRLTQAELAKLTGLSLGTIARIENGDPRPPRRTTVNALAAALGVTPKWLSGSDDSDRTARETRDSVSIEG